jgi:hypothetical protein
MRAVVRRYTCSFRSFPSQFTDVFSPQHQCRLLIVISKNCLVYRLVRKLLLFKLPKQSLEFLKTDCAILVHVDKL